MPAIAVGTAMMPAQAEILRMSSLSAWEVRASDACRIEVSSSSSPATWSRTRIAWSSTSRK